MDRFPHFSLRTAMASSEASETDAEREAREAKEQKTWEEEKEEDRWVNMIITDLLDEYIGLDAPLWNTDKKGGKRDDYRDKLCFLYSVSGGGFDWMNERINAYNVKRRKKFLAQALAGRNISEDMLMVFGDESGPCRSDQIAHSMKEITKETRAYIGPLGSGIFEQLRHVEHIFTTFPEGKVRREKLEIGGKTVEELRKDLGRAKFQVDDNGMMDTDDFKKSIYEPPQFTTLKSPENIDLVRLTVANLGFPGGATMQQIFDKAFSLGLEFCPPEVAPYYRLQYKNQSMHERIRIGMKVIFDRDREPYVFDVFRDVDDMWLGGYWIDPSNGLRAGDELLFRCRNPLSGMSA